MRVAVYINKGRVVVIKTNKPKITDSQEDRKLLYEILEKSCGEEEAAELHHYVDMEVDDGDGVLIDITSTPEVSVAGKLIDDYKFRKHDFYI